MRHLLEHLDPLPSYAYTAVQDGHIRIVELLPGKDYEPIVCLMYEANLDEHPVYEALSYVWGDPKALVSCVYIVGSAAAGVQLQPYFQEKKNHAQPQEKPCFLQITETLHCALNTLRHPEHSRHLWVDAICINQKDLCEQGSQVGIMSRIFGQAARVVAHLGYEEDGSENLPSVLEKIRDHNANRKKQGRNSLDHFWDEIDMSATNLEAWEPIRRFFSRPWYDYTITAYAHS